MTVTPALPLTGAVPSATVESFVAEIVAVERAGALVTVPAAVVDALGGGGRIKVRATFDDHEYQGSVVTMGGAAVIGVRKDVQRAIGKGPGDSVTVTLERDDAERTVTVPDDLAAALDAAGRRPAFDALSYSHRREYVTWIDEAKKADTRARRVAGTIERLGS
jgi:hypothetical protein